MQEFPINWWAVLVAAIVKFAIVGLWYSDMAFAPRWRTLTGCSEGEAKAGIGNRSLSISSRASSWPSFWCTPCIMPGR